MIRSCPRVALAILLAASWSAAQPAAPIPQQLSFMPYHATGIYDLGDTVGPVGSSPAKRI